MNPTLKVIEVIPLTFPWPCQDPFLFCVHHNDGFPKGNGKLAPAVPLTGRNLGMDFDNKDGWNMYHGETIPGFPSHPHRGFETVTVVRHGLIDHCDSLGGAARYGEGDTQWLTTGDGIVHSEMFPLVHTEQPNPTELFQIWLNLPAKAKRAKAHFSMLWNNKIPKLNPSPGVELALVAGRLGEAIPPSPPPDSWASAANAEVAIWTIKLGAGARWTLPAASKALSRNIYFYKGKDMVLAGESLKSGQRITLKSDSAVELVNGGDQSELLLLQGRPIGEPVAQYGPFVMNTRDEIQQAYQDYQRTEFGGWPWQTHDPVHPVKDGRFARFPDGRMEKPE